MDSYEEIDELNDETFGAAEDGDWELEHELFALAQNNGDPVAPDADQLPKFWEASEDVSFLWQPDALDSYKSFLDDEGRERGVNVEETLQKLVSEDDAFEDPAILDISKKVSHHKLSGSALDKLLGAPAFPAAPVSLFGTPGDIWSSETISSQPSNLSQQKHPSQTTSINLMDLLHQIAQTKGSSNQTPGVPAPHAQLLGPLEPHQLAPSSSVARGSIPADKGKLNFNGLLSLTPSISQCDMKTAPGSVRPTIAQTNVAFVPWVQRAESPSMHLSSNLLQKQRVDPTRLLTAMGMMNTSSTRTPTVTHGCGHNNIPDYLRASALQFLLMHTEKARLSGSSPLTGIPDPRYFQLMPPPGVQAVSHIPTPLLGPPLFMGTGQINQIGATLFQGSPNASIPFPFPTQQPSNRRVLPSNSVPFRPLSGMLSTPEVGQQRSSTTREGGVLGKFPVSHASVDEDFDPNKGSWMSDYESVGVLLTHLKPLIVSNPYVQDYYFAVCWLRRMTLSRAKQIAAGQVTLSYPAPVMHMPSPVTPDHLGDPTHYQHTAQHIKFVLPMVLIPTLNNRLQSLDSGILGTGDSIRDGTKDESELKSESSGKLSTGENTALGRPTRSNVYRPRVVIELSLASALSSDSPEGTHHHGELYYKSSQSNPSRGLRASRSRRMLLSRIERMYSLVLNVDEVDISLKRVLVENDTYRQLIKHRANLVQDLLQVLCSTSAQLACDSLPNPTDVVSNVSLLKLSVCELFVVRKGIRLFGTVLHYLPRSAVRTLLLVFVCNYAKLCTISDGQIDAFASFLYPTLRAAVYQISDISDFMTSCFPEVRDLPHPLEKTSETVRSLIHSKLGLSLIFCLLDVCARLSKPDDPSNFVRFGVYFSLVASDLFETQSTLEAFPHLASILPVYIKPEAHPPLTAAFVEHFCRLIDPSLISRTELKDGHPVCGPNPSDKAQRIATVSDEPGVELTGSNFGMSLTKPSNESDSSKRTTMVLT